MAKTVFRGMLLAFCLILILPGCRRSPGYDADARYYDVRGVVRGIAPDRSSVDVEHEDIRGFMPSMTMPFSVRNPKDIEGLKTGDAIAFRMVVTDKDLFLDRVRPIAPGDVHLSTTPPVARPMPTGSARLREGDPMPPFALTSQDGQPITNETFRGHPMVLTFIFTRCPVPNFCPRMSNNFAELQTAIQGGQIPDARLLSISLDPAFDTPAILKQYGAHLNADPRMWTLATGDVDRLLEAFSVYRQTEGGTISHGLATALVNGDGKVVKIWRGNAWTPAEVIEAIHGEKQPATGD